MSEIRFTDRTVLVIGAGSGLGEATALQFLKEGAKVVGVDIFEDRLERLKERAGKDTGRLTIYAGDINKLETVEGVTTLVKEKFGTLDHLAYVAGVMDGFMPPEALTDEVWDRCMETNVKSVWHVVRAAAPLMANHPEREASVVIVTSVGGIVSTSSGIAYTASKHAAEGLAKGLAYYYQKDKIRINSVAPGAFKTDIMKSTERFYPKEGLDRGAYPGGRDLYEKKGIATLQYPGSVGEPQYIADAITFLCSDQARFINCATLVVAGNWMW